MKTMLNCVLLIDDSASVNFYNKTLLQQADYCDQIVQTRHGKEALDVLTEQVDGHYLRPDLIFLDINMPIMDGWEFLVEYSKLDEKMKGQVLVVLLTSSLNPEDRKRASKIKEVDDFYNKPIDLDTLSLIMQKHFS